MSKKSRWSSPIDRRLIPNIFSFKYPKSPWVRGMLLLEMIFAVLVLVGTLILILLPEVSSVSTTNTTSAQ